MKTKVRTISLTNPLLCWAMLLAAVAVLVFHQTAWGAGTSSQSLPKTDPKAEMRKKANEAFRTGERFQDQKRFEDAAAAYRKAVEIDPRYAEAHSNLGYSYRKMGRFDEAVASYKEAIRLDPKLAEAYEYLGEAYAEMGEFNLAEEQLAQLRRLGSDEAEELAAFIAKIRAQKPAD